MAKMSPRELKKIVAEEMISKKSFDSKAYGREYYENNKEIIKATIEFILTSKRFYTPLIET